jgi:hypothetical protein
LPKEKKMDSKNDNVGVTGVTLLHPLLHLVFYLMIWFTITYKPCYTCYTYFSMYARKKNKKFVKSTQKQYLKYITSIILGVTGVTNVLNQL